jgi:hypothetical protein
MLALRGQMISRRASQSRKNPDFDRHPVARSAPRAALRCSIAAQKDACATFRKPTLF